MSSPKHSSKAQIGTYRKPDGSPVIFANRTQAANKAAQLGEGWHVKQSQYSRRFYVEQAAAPAAPQPRKATPRGEPAKEAQDWTQHCQQCGQRYDASAELERVKVAMMTTEAVRLQETRRAIKAEQQLAIAESCIKNNDAAFETVKQQRDDAIRTMKGVLAMISQRVAFSDESANDQKSLEILRGDCFIARQHIHEFIANAEKEAK